MVGVARGGWWKDDGTVWIRAAGRWLMGRGRWDDGRAVGVCSGVEVEG